jgi:hypothetical protein
MFPENESTSATDDSPELPPLTESPTVKKQNKK